MVHSVSAPAVMRRAFPRLALGQGSFLDGVKFQLRTEAKLPPAKSTSEKEEGNHPSRGMVLANVVLTL